MARPAEHQIGREIHDRFCVPIQAGERRGLVGHDRQERIDRIGRQSGNLGRVGQREQQLIGAEVEGHDAPGWPVRMDVLRAAAKRREQDRNKHAGEDGSLDHDSLLCHANCIASAALPAAEICRNKMKSDPQSDIQGALLTTMLAILVAVLFVLSLMTGPAQFSLRTVIAALFSDQGVASIIVRDIRLPRTLLAMLIGATFGLAGASLQGLLRNPLAEPSLFGAPQAAAAAAAAIMAFGLANALSLAVPLGGIAGALLSVGALVAIAGRRASLTVTLLAGLALASLAGAAIALILNLAPNPYIALEIAFWLLGSLRDRSMEHVWLAAPFMIVSWFVLAFNASAFRALTLGEDAAASLGVNVERTRILVVIGVALGVGAAVSVAGAISFVGLVAPHLVRRFYGSDPARVLLPASLAGAALLMAADIAVRLIPAVIEIKIGVVTALIGVPFFLAMIFHERRALEDSTQ